MPIQQGNAAGLHALQIFTVNNSGIALGQLDPTATPTPDTTSSAYLVRGATSSAFSPRTPTVVDFRDGDTFKGQMSFGGGDLQPFDISLDQSHPSLFAMVNNSSVDSTTNSVWRIFGANPNEEDLPTVGMILTQKYQSRESGSDGVNYYLNTIIPRAEIRVNPGGAEFQARSEWSLNVTPTMASKLPNGVAFGSNQGFEGNQTDAIYIVSKKPIALTTYIADGIETTFVAGYRPSYSTVTLAAAENFFAVNGTATALSSISTTTAVATMAAAGSSGDVNVLMYETSFTAV